jgi:hypothetical protein
MTDLRDMLKLMADFQADKLSATTFSERYTRLWKKLINEQDEAIERQPAVSRTLQELRDMNHNGEITPDRYAQRVQEQYALLQGVSIAPGSKVSEILDHVFVTVDAYRDDTDDTSDFYKTAHDLHETVYEALKNLKTD